MTRRSQTRTRGPGSATGAGAPDRRPWWAMGAPRPGKVVAVVASPLAEREADRLDAIASAAAAVQQAPDARGVFDAIEAAVERRGLSGHVATLDQTGTFLVIRGTMLPWAHQAQLERIHGAPMVGARIDLGPTTAHRAVVRDGASMHAPAALAWVLGVTPDVVPAEIDAISAFVGLGEVLLVPITDGREVSGVLTVWAPAVTRSERAFSEIVGRLAGGALSAQRARDVVWPGRAPTLAA
jgi:hypothetical protein